MILLNGFSETITIAILAADKPADRAAALSIPSCPTLQVPSPGGPDEAVDAVLVQDGCASSLLVSTLHSYYMLSRSGTELSVVLHSAADRSGSSLEADWLQSTVAMVPRWMRHQTPNLAVIVREPFELLISLQ